MRVTDLMKRGVVFVGHAGLDGKFIADGTGFVVLMEAHGFAFPYIVTAKHVIDQAAGYDEARRREILIRFNRKGGGVDYRKTAFVSWHTHPDHVETGRKQKYIDVAAFPLVNYDTWEDPKIDAYDFIIILEADVCTDDIIKQYAIGHGDEVVIPGLFHSYLGEQRNIPILRTGNIAAMRDEPFPSDRGPMDGYLVEMRSVGGISGSPVLTHMAIRPEKIDAGSDIAALLEKSKKTHFLLGLIHGHYTINSRDDWVFKTEQEVGDINAGIALVVPASKIMETICQPSAFVRAQELARQAQEHDDAISRMLKRVNGALKE
ncbi:hypothetical protein [Bradyrhizobium sp. NAS96.2]|uniref:hypothetical protein n=1 Tax=Bradyrhizobium sp. NAS96.2 TaxID=1680160 RepID=UPI00093AE48B|nr:hypothetical protein [Bradyrhizobium sp. NAS96.2]OKO77463.1 hypothetical protein AC628_15450 [Bradyrhizobium sp. NAS96.2]